MKRLGRVAGPLLLAAVAAALPLTWVVARVFAGGLPPLDGSFPAAGVGADVTLQRDRLGVVTVKAATRADVAFGLGFAHAQDRLFQMDLLRRFPAGELSELLGPATVDADRQQRVHRFRARAVRMTEALAADHRALLESYAAGVEAGRRSLAKPPWEYLLLRAEFAPWRPEDSVLVALGMFIQLQQQQWPRERARALLRDTLAPGLADFLDPIGGSWDAPLIGPAAPTPRVPTAHEVDLRRRPAFFAPAAELPNPGSNNWAVAGGRSKHGGAMVACDMHLGTRVPNVWYRASLQWAGRRVVGVTLPGTPAVIVGSNGRVAWGFTNAEVDSSDVVPVAGDVSRFTETIHVSGAPPVTLEVEETADGPVIGPDHRGRPQALRWVAHRVDGVNLRLIDLEAVTTAAEALGLAPRIGAPAQNLVAADDQGHIGWTVMGRLPRRIEGRWDGWIADPPKVLDPAEGIVWTANNRTTDDPRLGRGTYDNGARAMQIRDGLRSRPKMDESDMLAIQLDDRALFLARWRDLFLAEASKQPKAARPGLVAAVRAWDGRAEPSSVGARLVKEFRLKVRDRLLGTLTEPCTRADPRFTPRLLDRNVESSVWEVVTRRPPHLLPPGHATWGDFFAAVLTELDRDGKDVAGHTLGARLAPSIRHPLSRGLGLAGRWMNLDMDETPLPGDEAGLPRVQGPVHMASQRMAVSPGREADGYLHMPTGQSGHFLSPYYRAGHADWAAGKPLPLLPGPPDHTIVLKAGQGGTP